MEGFERGRNLEKIGLHAQDTAELFFTDVRVPKANLLGGVEGQGFAHLMQQLPQERMLIAIGASCGAWSAPSTETLAYTKQRKAFGQPIASSRTPASSWPRWPPGEDRPHLRRRLHVKALATERSTADGAMAKWWTTGLQNKVVDQCVQLHGGYGYMLEYPIARACTSTPASTAIYGGTTEIMKETHRPLARALVGTGDGVAAIQPTPLRKNCGQKRDFSLRFAA
jgi:alkylation response protein AidB-like acyl-CoA dehydrogenase